MEFSFFTAFLRRSPVILIAVVGIVVALVRWKGYPKVSLLTLLGMGLLLVQAVVFTIIFSLVSTWFGKAQGIYFLYYLIQDFFQALVIILLVTAALSQRSLSPVTAD